MSLRRIVSLSLISLCGLLLFAGFIALGNWQLERRLWKLDLIEKVETRVHAPAEAAPGIRDWPSVNKADDEYRHVVLNGQFLTDKDTLVVAATELGSGYWVLTPFQRDDGSIVLVNRGYIDQGVTPQAPPQTDTSLTGLLRLNEPTGSVLRKNSPSTNRWYSRDVKAIADNLGISAAPYFVDAGANPSPTQNDNSDSAQTPVGGLTVVSFNNSHLVYAITWYGLAFSVLLGGFIVFRESRRKH
ncbi:SURF1 family protein [Zhongshania sp.]|uniref:SURF1 family protein n=1 Tax=Zhongshania sp. TaxID=1971902 RepID=UPI003567D8B2